MLCHQTAGIFTPGTLQENVTNENAMRIVSSIAETVTKLDQDDEQSSDNFELIVDVFRQIDDLIEDEESNFTSNANVSTWHPEHCSHQGIHGVKEYRGTRRWPIEFSCECHPLRRQQMNWSKGYTA